MDDQDRQDAALQKVFGDDMMAGTLRLLIVIGGFSALGGVLSWYLARWCA